MFKNKKVIKIINLILCFMLLFSFGNISYAADDEDEIGFWDWVWTWFTPGIDDDFEVLYKLFLKSLTDLFISLGDGAMHLVASAVGETVTIDKLIYNDIKKVSIDYWNDTNISGKETSQEPIKAFMEPVVEKWYAVFFKIAIMVYMVVLVYIGISILLSSTAEKKASYKQLLTTWLMGITILFMFPFVMQYIILLNNAFVQTLKAKAIPPEESGQQYADLLAEKDFIEVFFTYGKEDFIRMLAGIEDEKKEITSNDIPDMMTFIRYIAGEGMPPDITAEEAEDSGSTKYEANLVLAIIYLILIGQMIAILVMYYKRAFMIAFLITIFPLVAMTYVLDKLRRW